MKLYKYRPMTSFDRVLSIVRDEQLYCAPYGELNDPFEGLFKLINSINYSDMTGEEYNNLTAHGYSTMRASPFGDADELSRDLRKAKICSLCLTLNEVRMWSLYADSCKGIAIEVEIPDGVVTPVTYSKTLPCFDESLNGKPRVLDVLSKKTHHWEYEEEFRIITFDGPYYSTPGMVQAIYTGPRMSDEDKSRLQKAFPKIQPIPMTLDEENVKIVPLKPQEQLTS